MQLSKERSVRVIVNRASALVLVGIALSTSACRSMIFIAANAPATFGDYQSTRDLAYGDLPRQQLDVYRPEHTKELSRGARPVIVFVHGGGWESGSKDSYRFVAESLTTQGFVVVVPSYRLYPEVKSPAFIDDIAHAVKWAHDHAAEYGGDANRLFLMGHSAGAQIAAMISYEPKFLLNAGGQISWIKGFIGLAGPYDFLPFTDEYLHDVFGPPSNYPQSQPINFVSRQDPRTLLIHGEADTVVAPKNSRNLAAKLRANGVSATEIYYPNMGHSDVIAALSVYFRNRRPLLHEITNFIAAN